MPDFATSIDIEAPPEVVFAHLVTPEGMLAWMGQHAELDATPGGVFAVDIDGTPVRGEYLEVDPPTRSSSAGACWATSCCRPARHASSSA